jgi:hypothetical protein
MFTNKDEVIFNLLQYRQVDPLEISDQPIDRTKSGADSNIPPTAQPQNMMRSMQKQLMTSTQQGKEYTKRKALELKTSIACQIPFTYKELEKLQYDYEQFKLDIDKYDRLIPPKSKLRTNLSTVIKLRKDLFCNLFDATSRMGTLAISGHLTEIVTELKKDMKSVQPPERPVQNVNEQTVIAATGRLKIATSDANGKKEQLKKLVRKIQLFNSTDLETLDTLSAEFNKSSLFGKLEKIKSSLHTLIDSDLNSVNDLNSFETPEMQRSKQEVETLRIQKEQYDSKIKQDKQDYDDTIEAFTRMQKFLQHVISFVPKYLKLRNNTQAPLPCKKSLDALLLQKGEDDKVGTINTKLDYIFMDEPDSELRNRLYQDCPPEIGEMQPFGVTM